MFGRWRSCRIYPAVHRPLSVRVCQLPFHQRTTEFSTSKSPLSERASVFDYLRPSLLFCSCGRLSPSDLVVAGAAVDGTIASRDERHLGHIAAFGADGRVHLSRSLTAEAGEAAVSDVSFFRFLYGACPSGHSAGRTACRLVQQSFSCVKLLFSSRKYKGRAAITTLYRFVSECQRSPSPKLIFVSRRHSVISIHGIRNRLQTSDSVQPSYP
jgi:hypothetical protein